MVQDYVKPISFGDTRYYYISDYTMGIPLKNLTHYYDVQSKEFKDQEFIELQLKIVSEKLDEVAKDENVESGVEDSEIEEN